ncbi:MAG TPA: hypothetical protein VK053_24455 [Jiangellaceae bacterium]|nr:hypothetical protein [Jiangellaceae bacterium]
MVPDATARLRFREMTADDLDVMTGLLGDSAVMAFYLEVGYHVCADQQGSRWVAEKIGMQHLEDDHGGSIPIRTVLAPLRHARTRIGRTWWTNRW